MIPVGMLLESWKGINP